MKDTENNPSQEARGDKPQACSLECMVRAMRLAQKNMDSYRKKWEAAEEDARSSDARWNEKFTDYWKGRRDGLRTALKIIGPNGQSSPTESA
jgi:hypothetical protein